MTLQELLKAKDDAVARKEATTAAHTAAIDALEKARAEDAEAHDAYMHAHEAISQLLCERGDHYLIGDDGTVTIYKGHQGAHPGWSAHHPVPGAPVPAAESTPEEAAS